MFDTTLVTSLRSNHVVVLPTDTVYGLACLASSPRAVKKMYTIKRRDGKPGTILAANIDQLRKLGFDNNELVRAQEFWPAPVSVILSADDELQYLHMGMQSLAVRIPDDDDLKRLLTHTGPLATTSANYPNKPTVVSVEQARRLFGNEVELYIDGGDLSGREPSKIIRMLDDGTYERLR